MAFLSLLENGEDGDDARGRGRGHMGGLELGLGRGGFGLRSSEAAAARKLGLYKRSALEDVSQSVDQSVNQSVYCLFIRKAQQVDRSYYIV